MWVWYPIILSRIKSFHHKKAIDATNKAETMTLIREILNLNHITIFLVKENRDIDKSKGQKEVCTAKKGLVKNIYSSKVEI